MHFLSFYFVRRTETNIQETIITNQSAVMCTKQEKRFLHPSRSIYKEYKKRKKKYSKRTRTWKTWKDQKVLKMPALHLTKSKSVQNLVGTGRGVHMYAAGKSMFPFIHGDLRESRETRKQSKKEYKVRISIRGEKEKEQKCWAGKSQFAIWILCMMTYSVIFFSGNINFKAKNPHHPVLEKTAIFISLLIRKNQKFPPSIE